MLSSSPPTPRRSSFRPTHSFQNQATTTTSTRLKERLQQFPTFDILQLDPFMHTHLLNNPTESIASSCLDFAISNFDRVAPRVFGFHSPSGLPQIMKTMPRHRDLWVHHDATFTRTLTCARLTRRPFPLSASPPEQFLSIVCPLGSSVAVVIAG